VACAALLRGGVARGSSGVAAHVLRVFAAAAAAAVEWLEGVLRSVYL
jgi:hypothetical protein